MSIDRRFGINVAVVFVPILVLSCWLFAHQWSAYARADEALESFQSFRLTLLAMEKVSAERGPTNGVLGEDLPIPAERVAALQRARHESDVQIALLIDSLRPNHCSRCAAPFGIVGALQSDLVAARSNVDQLARLARLQRGDRALQGAVTQMIGIIPEFLPVVTATTSVVVKGDPNALNCVIVGRLTADLREQAGQLGSRFTSALALRRPLTEDEQLAIERTRGRIEQLRAMVDARALSLAYADPQALASMNDQYFGVGLNYVAAVRVLATRPGGAGVSTAQFAQQYVPTMRAITGFRDSVIALAQNELRQNRQAALFVLVGTGLAEVLLVAVLIWMAAGFRRHVIGPFVHATRIIDAIARDDLTTEIPEVSARQEIRGMFDAMRVLKDNSAERIRLEQDRLHLIRELATMAQTDPLTRLLNRRAFESRARTLLQDAQGADKPVALIMFDIDHFKRINDTYGHAVGDDALRVVADLCRANWRQSDIVARIGGEEFAVLVHVQSAAHALDLAQRLRRRIAEARVATGGDNSCSITASFGIAFSADPDVFDVVPLLKRADRMLYDAKMSGRNCVMMDTGEAMDEQSSASAS
jgi:diguanylate cyclase (GGDEF)-like protein